MATTSRDRAAHAPAGTAITNGAMTRVLIIEDNQNLAFGLSRSLEAEGFSVAIAEDGPEGLAAARSSVPDLILLDLMLPGIDGYTVLRTLRDEGIGVPVLVLTARGEEADKVFGFRLGADDYVTKPFGLAELLERVKALLRRSSAQRADGGAAVGPGGPVERFGDVVVHPASRTVTKEGATVALTPKEFDLLLALLRRNGAVAGRFELLKEVWGHQTEVMTRTVDIHIAELRRKLEDDPSAPKHILTVWKAGYRLER
ncbi:MAG: response regulator transcription factor [Gemmatimonadaceae bacterium]